jgi:hypothetical protein
MKADFEFEVKPGYAPPDYYDQSQGTWTREPATGRVTFVYDNDLVMGVGSTAGNVLTITGDWTTDSKYVAVYRR